MKKNTLLSFLYAVGAMLVMSGLYSFTTASITKLNADTYQPKWENLKVLPQDISKDSLTGLMKGYNKSLGVKCTYCHIPKEDDPSELDFGDDSKKEKHIARGMITMTHEINENHFKPYYSDPKPQTATDVSCVICHRGTANPKEYLENLGALYPMSEEEIK